MLWSQLFVVCVGFIIGLVCAYGLSKSKSFVVIFFEKKTSPKIPGLDKAGTTTSALDNLPAPDELAIAIMENLEAGLESFRAIVASLESF